MLRTSSATTTLDSLKGTAAIGHVRYSTTGESRLANAQPMLTNSRRGQMALGHNGNLLQTEQIRAELEGEGAVFRSTTDSEVMLHLLARSRHKEMGQCHQRSFRASSRGFFAGAGHARSDLGCTRSVRSPPALPG